MPRVKRPKVVEEVYKAVRGKLSGTAATTIPTDILFNGRQAYRSIDPASPRSYFPKPNPGVGFTKADEVRLLTPPDGVEHSQDDPGRRWDKNRFTGLSHVANIPPAAGLYCVLQQQALVNELMHYTGNPGMWVLTGKCVLTLGITQPMLVADLSPHNEGARRFVKSLGKDMWEQMVDPEDCSVARGIGLAFAHSSNIHGLIAQTVRESPRSREELGDNFILFAVPGRRVTGISIERASFYGKTHQPEVFYPAS